MAVFRVERIKDYTVMSNHHLRNKTLSLKANALVQCPRKHIDKLKSIMLVKPGGLCLLCECFCIHFHIGIMLRRYYDDLARNA